MTAALAHRNRLTGKGTWTDEGSTFEADPPIANLGTPEVPSPNAKFTGTTAEFSFAALDAANAAETFTPQVLALIGHSLPDGALIEWQRPDGSLIAAQTWRRYANRPANSIIVLPAAESLNTIHCKISGVASATYRIGAAYAGELWEFRQEKGWEQTNTDDSSKQRVGSTAWTARGSRRRGIPVRLPLQTYADAFGVPLAGTSIALPTWDTDNSTSETGGVYTFTAVSGTLLSKTSILTTGEWHRVTVNLTQDAANTAVVSANLGDDGNQALQPGENTIIAKATDATLLFTASAAFTGTLEITKIEQIATGLTADHAQARLDEIGTTEPVIYFPRNQNQTWRASNAIYGLLEDGGKVGHRGGPYHDVEFSVVEMR